MITTINPIKSVSCQIAPKVQPTIAKTETMNNAEIKALAYKALRITGYVTAVAVPAVLTFLAFKGSTVEDLKSDTTATIPHVNNESAWHVPVAIGGIASVCAVLGFTYRRYNSIHYDVKHVRSIAKRATSITVETITAIAGNRKGNFLTTSNIAADGNYDNLASASESEQFAMNAYLANKKLPTKNITHKVTRIAERTRFAISDYEKFCNPNLSTTDKQNAKEDFHINSGVIEHLFKELQEDATNLRGDIASGKIEWCEQEEKA